MKTDVLIVGGGLSGLSVADHLNKNAIDFMLIEASHRLGGRVLTETIHGKEFDFGPTWFWPEQPRIAKMIERFGLKHFEQYSQGNIVFQDTTGQVFRNTGYSSMQGSYRLEGGIGSLIIGLKKEIPSAKVLLNTALQKIERTQLQLRATITGSDDSTLITAKKVILAMPPRLINQHVTFSPQLENDAQNALATIPTWMAGQAKILVTYDQPYWRQKGWSGDGMSQKGPMVEIHDASPFNGGPYALFGFVGYPAKAREQSTDLLLSAAIKQLIALYGSAMQYPTDIRMQDWAQDTLTATEKDKVGDGRHPIYGLPQELGNLWNGSLLFATAEMSHSFGGLLEGALDVAENVATKVIKNIQ